MLPGFRFLAATVLLTISIVVFALGAAALLRSTHGEFTGTQFTRATQEPLFAQRWDTNLPTIALLRADPAPVETPAALAQQPDVADKTGMTEDEPLPTAGPPVADADVAEPPAPEPILSRKTASATTTSVTDTPALPEAAPPLERLASLPAALIDVPEVKKEPTARQRSLRRARSKARRHFARRHSPKSVIQRSVVTPEIFLPNMF